MLTTKAPATIVVGVRLPLAVAAEMRKKAAANDRTVSSEMRRAARMYLEKQEDSDSSAQAA